MIKQLQDAAFRATILHATGMLESYAVCRHLAYRTLDGEHDALVSWVFVETHTSSNLPYQGGRKVRFEKGPAKYQRRKLGEVNR